MNEIPVRGRLSMGRRNVFTHASPTFEARFWEKVDKTENCWLWVGAKNSAGYGMISLGGRSGAVLAHRSSWELANGVPVPAGMTLDHLCRNRSCVNPEHLDAVSHAENVHRGDAGGIQKSKTFCPQGHPYDASNTYTYQGRRYCKECNRIQQQKENGVKATCHPDRPHRGRGMCNACYLRWRRANS